MAPFYTIPFPVEISNFFESGINSDNNIYDYQSIPDLTSFVGQTWTSLVDANTINLGPNSLAGLFVGLPIEVPIGNLPDSFNFNLVYFQYINPGAHYANIYETLEVGDLGVLTPNRVMFAPAVAIYDDSDILYRFDVLSDWSNIESIPGNYELSFSPSSLTTKVLFDQTIDPDFLYQFGKADSPFHFLFGYAIIPRGSFGNKAVINGVLPFNDYVQYYDAVEQAEAKDDTTLYYGVTFNPDSPVSLSDYSYLSLDTSRLRLYDGQDINVLPFRAYESVYNSFYRDERNNPFLINGEAVYDQYLPTVDGGIDPTIYNLHYRNWEQDFLTTALPTPQQGVAPLVGISSTGTMTFSDPESGKNYEVQAITADDADTIIGAKMRENVPNSVARSLVDYATSGISINDFRNVNALQRYLETNIRRGLKYKDMVEARFGVNVSYAELDMPEFIGGVTQDVSPMKVTQTVDQGADSPLGSYAGQLSAFGSSRHKIHHYCDEHGYILGIFSCVPVPVYSQLLHKKWTKLSVLDYFTPEFGHIGLQPIPQVEVSGNNVSITGNGSDTFGYQRAWYDYLANVDEVHGQFRDTLKDFVLYRQFSGSVALNTDFLLVTPHQLNNVFAVQDDSDKILGSIYFDIKMKRPIPRYGVPKLEA